mmetsp:Transcript_32077/g.80515  ORF Transcript_32077/g.80515 Transcript_32077/m.80515 type:complete len:86 (+) Transcript_32077:243-500(+)
MNQHQHSEKTRKHVNDNRSNSPTVQRQQYDSKTKDIRTHFKAKTTKENDNNINNINNNNKTSITIFTLTQCKSGFVKKKKKKKKD